MQSGWLSPFPPPAAGPAPRSGYELAAIGLTPENGSRPYVRIMRFLDLKGSSGYGEETAHGGTDHIEASGGGGPPGQGPRQSTVKRNETHTPRETNNNGRILRSVALKAAVALHAGVGTTSIAAVLEAAYQMQQWLENSAQGRQLTKSGA